MRFNQDSNDVPEYQEDEYSFTLSAAHQVLQTPRSGHFSSSEATHNGTVQNFSDNKSVNTSQTAKMKIDRLFGDSVQSSPVNTMGRSAGGSLASLYQARKANDSATVEQIKQHFQKQIEQMLQSSERHEATRNIEPPPQFRPSMENNESSQKFRQKITVQDPPLFSRASVTTNTLGNEENEVNFQNIPRGKSFLEARSAVQRQIEKMFVDANDMDDFTHKPTNAIKHSSHGVSHVTPDEEDTYLPPPPVHYGVNQALKSRHESPSLPPQSFSPNRSHIRVSNDNLSSPSKNNFENRTLERNRKFRSMDSISPPVTLNNSIVDLGNIDISHRRENIKNIDDRAKRSSMHEDMLNTPVPMREKKRKEDSNLNRRISIHQDRFDFNASDVPAFRESKITTSTPIPRTQVPRTPVSPQKSENEYEPIPVPLPSGPRNMNTNAKPVKHRIEYLGAVPLGKGATNLQALQIPLKELYFKNKALQSLGHSNLPGTLEISDTGMKIQYIRELHKGVQEIFNSFPTIAVWAAVKFVHKSIILPTNERRQRFAFLPLISDPESTEKTRAFYDLDYEEIGLAMEGPHPPVFACVMRRAGMPKQLECHGFICSSSEDAIIIAANLYQSLLDTMRKNKAAGQGKKKIENQSDGVKNLPRNDLARRSTRKSVRKGGLNDPPIRPPRRKRNKQHDEPRVVTGLQRRKSIRNSTRSARSNKSNRSTRSNRNRLQSSKRGVQNSKVGEGSRQSGQLPRNELLRQSTRKSSRSKSGQTVGNMKSSGDLFTKVSIGRTKSFVRTGNQYNLQELFRELKEKEGVDSIDDVLKRVISPNGMSFNDIKPVYRELLLKLAMTMSQDEIFERSKTIMASNKKTRKKADRHTAAAAAAASNSGSLGSFFKSFSKSNSKNNSLSSKKSTFTNPSMDHLPMDRTALDSGFDSNSSKTTKSNKPPSGKVLTKADISGPILIPGKVPTPQSKSLKDSVQALQDELVDDAYVSCSECGYESVCTYEACTCRIKKPQPRPSHEFITGYKEQSKDKIKDKETCDTSCECGDTDSCISSDKCYCSLRGDPRKNNSYSTSVYSEVLTDSGTATDTTCYSSHCPSSHSFVSRQNLSGCDSPQTAWKRNAINSVQKARCSQSCTCSDYSESGALTSSTRLSRNLPPVPDESIGTLRRKNSGGSGYTSNDSYASAPQTWFNVKNTRNEIRDGRGSSGASSSSSSSHRSVSSPRSISSPRSSVSPQFLASSPNSVQNNRSQNSKVLLLSAVDPRGNVVYRGASNNRPVVTKARDEENIMSLKKSAEIAALFSGARINQTTDMVDHLDPDSDFTDDLHDYSLSEHHTHSQVSQKLGYFP